MSDLIIKKKLRNIAEDINGERPSNRSLEGIIEAIEKGAGITYDPFPKTLKGRLRELGLQLNGVRPTQKSLRNIVNNIVENYEGGGGGSTKIYGVSQLNYENVSLARTDDAVGMNYTINSDGTITSDFDNVFPFNQMKEINAMGKNHNNTFIEIPSMWFRIEYDGFGTILSIAVSQKKGEEKAGAKWYNVKKFYYGKYLGRVVDSELISSAANITYYDKKPTISKTMDNFRSYVPEKDYYTQMDLYHKTVMNFLFLIEFANKNSSSLFPMNYDTLQDVGGTNTIQTPSGVLGNGRLKWHGIEDFYGNLAEYIEGIIDTYRGTSDISKYGQVGAYESLSYRNTNSGPALINNFGWDDSHPFLCMPRVINGEQAAKYFCDIAIVTTGNYNYYMGSYYGFQNACGMFNMNVLGFSEISSYVGARLLYCPNGA